MPELIYLAAPYSHPDPVVENERYDIATRVAAALIVRSGCEVFSPITHSHPLNRLAQQLDSNWHPTYEFWLKFDYHMLDIADWLYVLKLKGWFDAVGVKEEQHRFLLRRHIRYVKLINVMDYL